MLLGSLGRGLTISASKIMAVKVGIIGGTGLEALNFAGRETVLETPFGRPSDAYIQCKIDGFDCVLLSRHGRRHNIMPSEVNYRANIWGFHHLGCTHVLATTACGSLKEEIHPGDYVFLKSFIDRTTQRNCTFYDSTCDNYSGICHIPMDMPFCPQTTKIFHKSVRSLGYRCHNDGIVVTIEGPRYSSLAESNLYRSWNADVVNMTCVPEVVLAKELGLCYASMAMVSDYDCWNPKEKKVSVLNVGETMHKIASQVPGIIKRAIAGIMKHEWTETIRQYRKEAKDAVML